VGRRIVLEITEHAPVEDYGDLERALAPLREGGLTVAIDDAGAGFASLRHILRLRPDIIKVDKTLTQGIEFDSSKRALARALITFARDIGAEIVAEGIETSSEQAALHALGVRYGQGYHIGRPAPLADALGSSRAS
jgi:EAL domain-containing protein (putative c-di-GMP-specific phosphodiesterase class I)